MGLFFKSTSLIYFVWFAFFTKSEKDIDLLLRDKKLLDEKIKNISDALAAIRDGFGERNPTTDASPPIAQKTYYIPLGKVQLRKFIIDMTVDMNYLKNNMNNESNPDGNLKATADVNAKLVEDEDDVQTYSRPVKKKGSRAGHFEYFSPMFKINLQALPVGVHLFVPIHKITLQNENTKLKHKAIRKKK